MGRGSRSGKQDKRGREGGRFRLVIKGRMNIHQHTRKRTPKRDRVFSQRHKCVGECVHLCDAWACAYLNVRWPTRTGRHAAMYTLKHVDGRAWFNLQCLHRVRRQEGIRSDKAEREGHTTSRVPIKRSGKKGWHQGVGDSAMSGGEELIIILGFVWYVACSVSRPLSKQVLATPENPLPRPRPQQCAHFHGVATYSRKIIESRPHNRRYCFQEPAGCPHTQGALQT